MRRVLLTLVVVCVMVGACSKTNDRSATTTTTTHRSTTTSSSVIAPTSTTVIGRVCARVTTPADATNVHEQPGDVDGDGKADRLRSYQSGSAWHLQVILARGGGADLVVPTYQDGFVDVLGGADVDGDRTEEVWARTGVGASATILGVARLLGCDLLRVTTAGGGPAELPIGGSVGTTAGAACDAHVDPSADLTMYTATNTTGDHYDVRATEYSLDGPTLVQRATETIQATMGDRAFARASSFRCGNLSL